MRLLVVAGFDVFVSYAHVDRERVVVLRDALTRTGLRVWLDDGEIDTFASISRAIEHGLEHSRVLVAFYSHAYPLRRACQWELTAAMLAAQRAGRDPRDRVLVINPENGAGHVEPVELRDALYAPPPATEDAVGWHVVAERIAAQCAACPVSLVRWVSARAPHCMGVARSVPPGSSGAPATCGRCTALSPRAPSA